MKPIICFAILLILEVLFGITSPRETLAQEIVLFEDFEDGVADGFTETFYGAWYVSEGTYCGWGSGFQPSRSWVDAGPLTEYTIDVDCTAHSGDETKVIYAHADDSENYRVDFWLDRSRLTMPAWGDEWDTRNFEGGGLSLQYHQTYHVKVEVTLAAVRVWVDGDLRHHQPWARNEPLGDGKVGVGVYQAQSCFDNVTVALGPSMESSTFSEDFDYGVADGFEQLSGTWAVANGEYVQSLENPPGPHYSRLSAGDFTLYTIHVDCRLLSGEECRVIYAHADSGDDYRLDVWLDRSRLCIPAEGEGWESRNFTVEGLSLAHNETFHVTIEVGYPGVKVWINNTLQHDQPWANAQALGDANFALGTNAASCAFDNLTAHLGEMREFFMWYVDASAPSSGHGATWGGAFQTIQEGIAAANSGHTVIVAPGQYVENVKFGGKSVLLRSKDSLDPAIVASTIIDGNQTGPAVEFSGPEGVKCVLCGFTIKNGHWGIQGRGTRATIENNTMTVNYVGIESCGGLIRNNTVSANDGRGFIECDGTILGNVITDNKGGGLEGCDGIVQGNTISLNSASSGGGLAYCGGLIADNVIRDNTADGGGGGLVGCTGTIQGNEITGNGAGRDGGGLVFCHAQLIQGNTITNNMAGRDGGGLADCGGAISRNTVVSNVAVGSGGGFFDCDGIIENNVICRNASWNRGGGMADCGGTISNNTIVANSALWRGAGLYYCRGTVRNSVIWGNRAPEESQISLSGIPLYCCIENWMGGGEGSIASNPRFVDPDRGDYHLWPWSPCIDAGHPGSAFENEPEPNGGRVNMGAYGNTAEATSKAEWQDEDDDGLHDLWETHWFGGFQLDGSSDPDGDQIPNSQEFEYSWNPIVAAETLVENLTKGLRYETIQTAITASNDGDEIVVHPGVYDENVRFNGKNVVLRSTDPLDSAVVEDTIVDGGGLGSVVVFDGTEDENCLLHGLTIRNGTAPQGAGICGGSGYGPGTHATIERNRIRGNVSRYGGGGLAFCDGLILGNLVTGNTAGIGAGGGLYACHGMIDGNTITNNSAEPDGGGGLASCAGTIQNNLITENAGPGLSSCQGLVQKNVISDNSDGGLGGCHGSIRGNRIIGNSSSKAGGGLAYCGGPIQNNVIIGNTGILGGGLLGCGGTIEGNLIVGNVPGGLRRCSGTLQNNTIVTNPPGFPVTPAISECRGIIRNCIIWGNGGPQIAQSATPLFCCIQDWSGGGEGNISDDPGFLDPDGDDGIPETLEDNDYRLNSDSPCIDAGVNYYWYVWPECDLDGNCRLAGTGVDLGCYEYASSTDEDGDLLSDRDELTHSTDPSNPDTDADGLRDGLEILRGSLPLETTLPEAMHVSENMDAIQKHLCLAVEGDEIVVSPGVYRGNLQFCGANVILRSEDPEDMGIVGTTVLDGDQAGPVVSFSGSEDETCLLAGFTVRNGQAESGAGIRGGLWQGSACATATVENNIIAANSAWEGGGLFLCNGLISKNIILGNTAEYRGGGLASCDGIITGNIIGMNSATDCGGGLDTCVGMIDRNVIAGNWAGDEDYSGSGGGLMSCADTVQNNLIAGNTASGGGGSVNRGEGIIRNNTIVYNIARNSCGGLNYSMETIENCIIWGNDAPINPQLCSSLISPSDSVSYSCIQDGTGGEGNIAEDPLFHPASAPSGNWTSNPTFDANACQTVLTNGEAQWPQGSLAGLLINPNVDQPLQLVVASNSSTKINVWGDATSFAASGDIYQVFDYRLSAASPCIDSGRNGDWMWDAEDLDKNPRIFYGISSITVDMGVYEYASWPFHIAQIIENSVGTELSWVSRPGDTYVVWSCGDLPCSQWTEETTLPSQGQSTTWTDPNMTSARKFYIIEIK